MRPWSVRMVDELALRGPIRLDELMAIGSGLVPPGRALRTWKRRVGKKNPPRTHRSSEDHGIVKGAEYIVGGSIKAMLKSKSLEKRLIDGIVYIELTDLGRIRLIDHDEEESMDIKIDPKLIEWLLSIRRYMKHDQDCSIWNDQVRVCDCGLDAAMRKLPKQVLAST